MLEHLVVGGVWTYPDCHVCCRIAYGNSDRHRIRHANSNFSTDTNRDTYTYPNADGYAH